MVDVEELRRLCASAGISMTVDTDDEVLTLWFERRRDADRFDALARVPLEWDLRFRCLPWLQFRESAKVEAAEVPRIVAALRTALSVPS